MSIRLAAVAAAAGLSLAATMALAQGGPDPARVQLARRMLQASGEAEGIRDQMQPLAQAVTRLVRQAAPPGQERLADAVSRDMAEEQVKTLPAMLDEMAMIYADHLTSQEMSDAIAWYESPSGRSIRAKGPALAADLAQRQNPRFAQMSHDLVLRAIEHACDESRCSSGQREQVLAAVERAMTPAS